MHGLSISCLSQITLKLQMAAGPMMVSIYLHVLVILYEIVVDGPEVGQENCHRSLSWLSLEIFFWTVFSIGQYFPLFEPL